MWPPYSISLFLFSINIKPLAAANAMCACNYCSSIGSNCLQLKLQFSSTYVCNKLTKEYFLAFSGSVATTEVRLTFLCFLDASCLVFCIAFTIDSFMFLEEIFGYSCSIVSTCISTNLCTFSRTLPAYIKACKYLVGDTPSLM